MHITCRHPYPISGMNRWRGGGSRSHNTGQRRLLLITGTPPETRKCLSPCRGLSETLPGQTPIFDMGEDLSALAKKAQARASTYSCVLRGSLRALNHDVKTELRSRQPGGPRTITIAPEMSNLPRTQGRMRKLLAFMPISRCFDGIRKRQQGQLPEQGGCATRKYVQRQICGSDAALQN